MFRLAPVGHQADTVAIVGDRLDAMAVIQNRLEQVVEIRTPRTLAGVKDELGLERPHDTPLTA